MKKMRDIIGRPLEETLNAAWQSFPVEYRRAMAIILMVNLAAFGFQMANLSLHHDDVSQFFSNDGRLGHQLGRYGYSWLHHYIQGSFYLPFLQLLEGILLTITYSLIIAHAFGLRKMIDVVFVGSIVSIYPYMAQLYQYDTSVFPYAFAHLLAGLAALLSLNYRLGGIAAAALLYVSAFAIYQSVLSNALAVIVFATIFRLIPNEEANAQRPSEVLAVFMRAIVAMACGGILYIIVVKLSGVPVDSYQGADKAFSVPQGIDIPQTISAIVNATRGSLVWPENYFPLWAKQIQLALIAAAGVFCLVTPTGSGRKVAMLGLLLVGLLAPRALQFLHPNGSFHNLTVTAYAVVVAGAFAIVIRCAGAVVRNGALIAAALIVYSYLVQANWMATVNHLNWSAHQLTMSQILTRVDSLPRDAWDGKTVAVVGKLKMAETYPFKKQTGMADAYVDERHFQKLSRLLRQEVQVVTSKELPAEMLRTVANFPTWPAPGSVQVFENTAVVVLSSAPQD